MATHLAESQEADRYLVPPLEIEGGYWQSTTDQALTQQSLPPPSSCGDGDFSFSPIDGSANQSWGTSSINPNGSSSFSIYSSDSDALVPLPSLPVSSFVDNSLNCSSEQGFPSSSVAAQGAKSLSVVSPSSN